MTQPHIIFITTDHQRYDACAPYAPDFLRLPHSDRLACEGVSFRSAYAESPVCVPARQTIMTGKSVFTLSEGQLHKSFGINNCEETLPAELRRNGYHTSLIGKAHFGPAHIRYGFDEMKLADEYYREMARSGNPQQPMRHGLGQNEYYPAMATVPESSTLTSWTAEQACEFIRYRRDPSQPFFLWVSFHKPHPPLDPPEPYYSMYRDTAMPAPVMGDWLGEADCPPALRRTWLKQCYQRMPQDINPAIRAAYYGLITQIDYNIGRIFQALMDTRLDENTLILYSADHGEFLGDHGVYAKATPHEASAHVPMLLRLPPSWGDEYAGTECTMPVTHVDILPTLVAAAGGEIPPWAEGINLLDVITGKIQIDDRYIDMMWQENAYWNHDYNQPDFIATTNGKWKYIWYPEGGREQLFYLPDDPHECHNLAGDSRYADQCALLRAQLIAGQTARGTSAVCNGSLVEIAEIPLDERRLQAQYWEGYHGGTIAGGDILH